MSNRLIFRIACVVFGLNFSVVAFSADPHVEFLITSKKPKSKAVAAFYAKSPSEVLFVRQLGIAADSDQQTVVATGPSTYFWDTGSTQKKLDLRKGKTTWLPVSVVIPKSGSLDAAPPVLFFLKGLVPEPFSEAQDPRDSIRNEYISAALLLKNTAAAWNAYGPKWTGPIGKVVELFDDRDFQPLVRAADMDLVEEDFTAMNDLESDGCHIGKNGGIYPYPYVLDIDGRLYRAKQEVMNSVVDYFYAHAQREKLNLTRSDVARLFRISSAYRNPARNICVGGDPFSRHQWGLALDLSVYPNSTHAAKVASVLKLDIGTLWREYRDVAARALSSDSKTPISCKQGRLRANPNPLSRFSTYEVFCGCEGNGEFLNCDKDAMAVDHVHVGF